MLIAWNYSNTLPLWGPSVAIHHWGWVKWTGYNNNSVHVTWTIRPASHEELCTLCPARLSTPHHTQLVDTEDTTDAPRWSTSEVVLITQDEPRCEKVLKTKQDVEKFSRRTKLWKSSQNEPKVERSCAPPVVEGREHRLRVRLKAKCFSSICGAVAWEFRAGNTWLVTGER